MTKRTIISLIVLALPAVAAAQEPPPDASATTQAPAQWSFAVAPHAALDIPTSKLGLFAGGGLELDIALPVLDHKLVLALDATITRPPHDGTGTETRVGGAYNYTVHETELKVALDVVYRLFGADHTLVPYFGIGPMLHMLKTTESTDFAPGDNTEKDTKFGFELVAGVDFKLGPGYLLGEGRLVYSGLDHLLTGDTNAGNVTFGLGYRITF